MGEAVSSGIRAAVFAGVHKSFAHGLFQRRDTGEVLGVNGDIVNPALTAVVGVAPVHGCHGQREEKRCGGFRDHFRYLCLNDEVQTERKIARGGVAVAVGQRHCCAAIFAHEAL